MSNALVIKNLCKSYGSIDAVKGLSLSVKQGEIFALIGPNGAGKSTTLRMVATLLTPTSGDVAIFNHSIVNDSKSVRGIISYLPEEAGAYKNMSGKRYLQFMAELFTQEKSLQKEYFERGCELSGLGDRLSDKASTYSKGMTRKLLLARTVMSSPKVAILDEPTSGLDISNAITIRKTIRDLANKGMTVLLSSHNMLEIEYLSDRVGLIAKGQLHDIGTPEELKKRYSARNLEDVFMAATK